MIHLRSLFTMTGAACLLAGCIGSDDTPHFSPSNTVTPPPKNENINKNNNSSGKSQNQSGQNTHSKSLSFNTANPQPSGTQGIRVDYYDIILDNEIIKMGSHDVNHHHLNTLSLNGVDLPIILSAPNQSGDSDFYYSEVEKVDKVNETTHKVHWRSVGKHLKHALYGGLYTAYVDDVPHRHDYVFAQGESSASLPQSGRFEYQGRALFFPKSDEEVAPIEQGASHFTVDFGNKSLNGTLSFTGQDDIKLNAQINGNRFSSSNGTVSTQGGFYGDNAAELAGIFHDGKDKNLKDASFVGAFGASKK